jgi:hypothetical protein
VLDEVGFEHQVDGFEENVAGQGSSPPIQSDKWLGVTFNLKASSCSPPAISAARISVRTCTSDKPSPRKVNPTAAGCALHYTDVNWGQYEGTEACRPDLPGWAMAPPASRRSNRNDAARPWRPTRMVSLSAILAALFGLALTACMVLWLPAWAALCVALGAVALVMLGGGALLAKVLLLCAVVLMAARFMRRRER